MCVGGKSTVEPGYLRRENKANKNYTSGQSYGISTTKLHSREFDQYLLVLVVRSIAERNTVNLMDPLRNQIEWPNIVLSGDY